MNVKVQSLGDKAAIGLSMLCLVHCLILPLLLFVLPPLAGLLTLSDEAFHEWLLIAVLPISVLALGFGYLRHKSGLVVGMGLVGCTFLVLATILGEQRGETLFTVLGSMLITYAHLRNYALRRNFH
ncbi:MULTISPECIES: MerC domain-containing protein [unclassified Pseudoalteromonas]|uniref:MerC domain-containing protein n=1 Tax=unclassified Pseudoalteromonas TaxID=194690 RepID=UPI000C7B4009|nr:MULTISPECIES: MerC domain-containing protein [unclassified Pseudoalteromonas]AUJ69249.1 MerC mercury resistance protein [Pseudoalteromonas sp. NC201]MCF7514845.1 MerC domain-containing protein [Pseudoalteromonas sp. L7]MCF7526887.1 MerC domain-containing protein [Pseudoalteromonas sp. L23]MCX2768931.1 MerC domain-containing protein [Pseudoalteromonas sp. B530]